MDLNGWKKNILLTIIFVVYLILGAAIFYGFENDVPPPPPDAKTMYIMKTMSEKQMEGIQKGMSMAVPQVATMYKGQNGKETFDEGDVSKIAEMALTKVIQMVKVQMAQAFGGKKGAPQASRHTAPNGNPETMPENSVESNPSYQNVPENKEENVVTEDKTTTEDMDNEETRRKRQAENETETMTTPAPTTTTTPEEQNKTPERPKPGYSSFIYLVLTGVTTIGYGNVCPHTVGGQLFFMVYITLGIPLFFFVVYKIAMAKRAATIAIHTKILRVLKKEALSTRVMNLTRLLLMFVPGFIVLMLVCPAIFSHVEDWSYIQSMYFVFSTITTIGFGDFYPGMMMGIGDPMEISSAVRGIYMVFVFLYMFGGISWVFGLGLMTFDCCCKRHQTKEITQKNGISTPPKITVVDEVEKNEVDLEKTEQPLLDETTKEVEMEEIKKEENNGENENA